MSHFFCQGMARLYAKALYLLRDHHVMCVLHDYLTEFLMMEGRMEEAAYHSHERLVILLNIMGRCACLFWGLVGLLCLTCHLAYVLETHKEKRGAYIN